MDVPGAFYFDFAVSDANSHWEDNSSVMSSRFVEEMENPDCLTTELYWRTDFEPSISSCSYIFCHPQTDIVSPHWEQEWHLIIPNPSLCPLFLVLCHFDFAFWICLWLSASPIFFFWYNDSYLVFPQSVSDLERRTACYCQDFPCGTFER